MWNLKKNPQQLGHPPAIEQSTSTTPIIGYRIWKTETMGGEIYLSSVAYSARWPHRKAIEVDVFNNKGIHSLKDPGDLPGLWNEYQPVSAVAGEVYLWGKVTECELGYLSEFAYPKRLFVPEDTDPTIIIKLEDGYGVGCEMRAEFVRHLATPTAMDPAGIGLYPQSQMQQAWNQAQQFQQYAQQLSGLVQNNAQQMMQNAMLYGTGISKIRTYPGGIFTVDPYGV